MSKKLTLHLDFRAGLPIYIQIVNRIQSQLANGILHHGDQLPTVRALAEELRINFNTVARAYRILDEARIISTQQGRGTYIMEIPPPEVAEKLKHESLTALTERFVQEATRLGFTEREITQTLKDTFKTNSQNKKEDQS